MGFQTLVILQGQAPDTPTLLEAFIPLEAGKKKKNTGKQKLAGRMVHVKYRDISGLWTDRKKE